MKSNKLILLSLKVKVKIPTQDKIIGGRLYTKALFGYFSNQGDRRDWRGLRRNLTCLRIKSLLNPLGLMEPNKTQLGHWMASSICWCPSITQLPS